MNALKKIAGINLAILIAYTILSGLVGINEKGQYKGLGALMLMAVLIGLHVGVAIVVSLYYFVRRNREKGRAYLLSALLVLVIGFSACMGLGSFY
jgi:hypothetical protein